MYIYKINIAFFRHSRRDRWLLVDTHRLSDGDRATQSERDGKMMNSCLASQSLDFAYMRPIVENDSY